MRYLADTIVQHVLEASSGEGTHLFVLPSYPAELLLRVGRELEECWSRDAARRVTFVYGVAHGLGEEWHRTGDGAALERLRERGWYNEENNLTSLRNRLRDEEREDALVTVLAGYDHIPDRASLRDFYHLDDRTIWRGCLGRSFGAWVEARFGGVLDRRDEGAGMGRVAEVLGAIYEQGMADLVGISSYLEALRPEGIWTGTDAYRMVLGDLGAFRLPPMMGLVREGQPKIADQVAWAQEFANYSLFMEPSAKRRARAAIEGFRDAPQRPEPEEGGLGEFRSVDDLVEALERYVEERSEEDRRRLLSADVTYIRGEVLGYKEDRPKPARPAVPRKLQGLPPEVFLRAVWLTLGDYAKAASGEAQLPEEDLAGITIESTLFRHDFDAGEEEDSASDKERALGFLGKVLGGIDELLESIEIGGGEGREQIGVTSRLSPGAAGNMAYRKTSTAEPTLAFRVRCDRRSGRPVERRFLWRLPQEHQSRLLVDLCDWAYEGFARGGNALPAYPIPHLPEIFMARDEEEVTRITRVALQTPGLRAVDLLSAAGISASDPVYGQMVALSQRYQGFLRAVREMGFFGALGDPYDGLRKAYLGACEALIQDGSKSSLDALLFKAFYLVDRRRASDEAWKWDRHLAAGVATPLHPAVLDMLRHQHAFMRESLAVYASEELREPGPRSFGERAWNRVVDLARVERPVYGTIADNRRVLDSSVRSYGYVHLVGQCRTEGAQLSARLLLDYDEEDEEDVTDTELFRETQASNLVCHTLGDYRALRPHANDGMSIGAYCGGEIQPIVAGIDAYLREVFSDRREWPYGLQVTIFSAGRDDSSVTRWLRAWRDRWQEAELTTARQYYARCRISIAYRVVPGAQSREQLATLLRQTPLDVMFFSEFVAEGASHFQEVDPDELPSAGFRQFPVLEMACCAVSSGAKASRRDQVLSHRRFRLAAAHAEVMARINRGYVDPKWRHVVVSESDFSPWEGVMAAAHEESAWVVCIDSAVDEALLRRSGAGQGRAREIIGFGTGVGAHGENNITISTERFGMADVTKKIAEQLASRLGPWEASVCQQVAQRLIHEAQGMAGLSVVKATGPSEYVRDYIAYATLRKMMRRDETAFCDEVVSLDAFRHWFSEGGNGSRPDLLRLRAEVVDGCFQVHAQVLECKLAQRSEGYLAEARGQVEAGLERLVGRFQPRIEGKAPGVGDRPDQRYWWMQLHRLLASRGHTDQGALRETLSALERLAEGFFSISWQGAVVAIWTDDQGAALQREAEWQLQVGSERLLVPALTAGAGLVRAVCLEGVTTDAIDQLPAIRRSAPLPRPATPEEPEDLARDETGPPANPPTDGSGGASDGRGLSTLRGEVGPSEGKVGRVGPDTPEVPGRIYLGKAVPSGRATYWEFGHEELPNRHILVFGASGTGKTYTIQALLCELGKAGQNALIVDYTNGFTTGQLEETLKERLSPVQHAVRREPLPINPFRQQSDVIDEELMEEDPSVTGQRVTGVFSEVYQLGDQQKSVLYTAIRDGLSEEGAAFGLDSLMERLEEAREAGGPLASPAASVLSRITPFVDMKPFGREDPESWEALYQDRTSRCHIIQLAGFSRDVARLITEFSLIDLYRYYRATGAKDRPRVVVLDEVQNLDHSLGSPLGQLLTEGRKFGISLILATQTLSNLDRDQRDRLFQASHKLFFKPADTELRSFAQILEDATNERSEEWVRRLAALSRGECYSVGPARGDSGALDMKRYAKIRIEALEKRY